MSPVGYYFMVMLGTGLLVWLALWYADRAIRERRPGWVDPQAKEDGVRCPHAVGQKGDPGPAGQEEK